MGDFEPPSFSLGLDYDLLDSQPEPDPQIISVSEDDDYETLIVDDSEPEFHPDPYPKLKRLRRLLATGVTTTSFSTISAKPNAEFNSSPVVNDEDDDVFFLQDDKITDKNLHTQNRPFRTSSKSPNTPGALTNQITKKSQTTSQRKRLLLTVSDSDTDDPSVSNTANNMKSNGYNLVDLSTTDDSLPPALFYFFHNDQRIKELVQIRLPNFSPLWKMPNRDIEQPSTSEIDYMGQFSSKEGGRNNRNKKSISSRKISNKEEIEETSEGWVNPKLCVDNVIRKGDEKRKVHGVPKTAGYWVTGSDGKRVYVGKKGQELTGRVAYMQYKKESGSGFKKAKRKFATKKKK